MKKALSAVLAVVLVLGVCFSVPMIASAENADKFTYELDNAENPTGYIITGVKDGVTGPVEIPATYKPEGNINVFYPKAQEAVNLGEVTGVTVVINGEGDEDDHGTVTVSEETVEETTTVTLEMAADEGYKLGDVTVVDGESNTVTLSGEGNTRTFVKEAEATYTVTVAFTEIEYNVTLTQPEVGGTISALANKGVSGATVTLTAEADDEYTFERWIVTGEGASVEGNVLTIGTADVTVTAEFSKNTYNITFADGTTGVKAYDANGEVATAAPKDAVIEIKPDDSTKIVETVTVKDAEDNDIENLTVTGNKFTMPGEAVKVAATLVQGYAVNVAATENGTVTVNKTLAAEGDFITVTTTPAPGYKLGTLKVAYAGAEGEQTVTAEADGEHKGAYEMPAAAVTVTATFVKEEYTITLPTNVINGTIAIKDATEETKFYYGDTIELTLAPAPGCQLAKVEYTYEGLETPVAINENGSFSMPAKNITINVTFAAKELPVIGIKAGALNGATGVTAYTVHADQTRFVAEDGVLFEKVEGGLKLIAFPAAYEVEVEEGEVATYTIPAKVPAETGLAVTEVADGAFQALGNVRYVFCAGAVTITESAQPAFGSTSEGENPTFTSNKKFHTTANHTEDDGEITTPATCQVDGVKTFKCEDCKFVLRTEPVKDANAHRFLTENEGWVVETPATCIYDGIQRRYCQNQGCNYVETETIDATNEHVAGEGVILEGDEATCTEEGTKTFYCTGCNTEVVKTEVIPATGHKISDPDVVVKATCTEDGYVKGICDNCETEQTIPETKKGHKMITVVDAEATCTVAGSQHEECETCGYMDEDAVIGTIPALGHSKAEETAWTIVTEATCAEAGLLQKFCDTCHTPLTDKDGKEITRVLEATGEHEYKDYKETKAPTCTEKGAKTGTCACGATDVQEIAAIGHKFEKEFTTDKEATCTEAGSKSKHCTAEGCKEKSEVTAIPVIAHTLPADAETVTPATCHSVGTKKGTCTVCKTADVTVEIPMLAHTWAEAAVPVVGTITKEVEKLDKDGKPVLDEDGEPVMETITYKAATCEAEGYTVKYCTVENCDAYDEESLTKVDKLGHDFDETHDTDKPSNIQPTCDEVGYKFVWCKRCSEANKTNENKGYVKVEVAATGHNWEEKAKNLKEEIEIEVDGKEVTAKAPDCENAGYTAIYCATCGDYKDVTPVAKLGHSVLEENWTTKSEATCVALKVERNTCNRCDKEVTREVGKLADHDFSETKTTVYPTCEEDGVEYFACTVEGCKARDQEKVLPALGHIHGDNKLVGSEPTCITAGVKTQACTRLFYEDGSLYVAPSTDENDTPTTGENNTPSTGDSNANGDTGSAVAEGDEPTLIPCEGLTVTTPATGHAFSDEYTTDVEPTCTKDGSKSRHCTNEGCDETTGTLPVKALGHEFGEKYTVDTKATCSAVGYESIHCIRYDDCETKKTGSTREIPKTDHTYDDVNGWVVDVRATCTTEGSRHNDCKVCGETGRKTEKIVALGHDIANATLQTKAATCLADGETYKLCERYIETAEGVKKCGEKVVIEELEATGHNVETWDTEANPATCTTAGSKTGLCQNANCPNEGKLVTETIPATGHKFDTQPTRTEPTCTEPGRLTGTCSVCELENVYNEIPAKGHTWGDWELAPVAEGATADCTVQGGMIRYCTVANCDGSELGKNDEHTVSSWIIGTKATCGTAGEMHTECKVCAKVIETEAIAATGKHDLKETVTLEPTCNEKGSKTVECQAKDCTYTATVAIPANGHSYTDWKVFVEPTCTTKGIRQSVCEVCLTTQSEKILALGHDLGEFIVDEPAKCNVKGSQHKECSRCDYTETAEIAALEHNFVGNDCANKCGAKIYEYALVEGSTTDIIITKYNGSDENLVIPAEIDGYKVVAIGNRAFMKTEITPATEETEEIITYVPSTFTSLTIPASITTIGDYAFGNSLLTLVNIPATVTTIGKCAFGYDVVITMEPAVDEDEEETQTPAEGETPAEDEEVELVEKIVATKVAGFTIYGVKDSAAEAYAKQDAAEGEEYNFTFVEVKDVYDVVIDEEETNIVEVADGVIFKEFEPVVENDDSTKIANQIKAVIELPEDSDYTVDVEASQSYDVIEKDEQGNETVKETLSFYGTGSKILVKDGDGKVVDEIVIIVEGDVNGDGAIDAIDCMLIQLAAAANSTRPLEGVYKTAGDIQENGNITADDLNQAVLKIFGEDRIVGGKEEATTAAPTTAPTTTEPTTQAPASTEPSTEGTSGESTPAESTPAESTPAATESQPASSEPAATTTTTQAPAPSESTSDTPAA